MRPKKSDSPTRHELDRLEFDGQTVNVINRSAASWERIATRLYFKGNVIASIKKNSNFQVEPACTEVFERWLNGTDGLRTPVTWATVVQVLREADLGALSIELNSILSD